MPSFSPIHYTGVTMITPIVDAVSCRKRSINSSIQKIYSSISDTCLLSTKNGPNIFLISRVKRRVSTKKQIRFGKQTGIHNWVEYEEKAGISITRRMCDDKFSLYSLAYKDSLFNQMINLLK